MKSTAEIIEIDMTRRVRAWWNHMGRLRKAGEAVGYTPSALLPAYRATEAYVRDSMTARTSLRLRTLAHTRSLYLRGVRPQDRP